MQVPAVLSAGRWSLADLQRSTLLAPCSTGEHLHGLPSAGGEQLEGSTQVLHSNRGFTAPPLVTGSAWSPRLSGNRAQGSRRRHGLQSATTHTASNSLPLHVLGRSRHHMPPRLPCSAGPRRLGMRGPPKHATLSHNFTQYSQQCYSHIPQRNGAPGAGERHYC